MTISRLAFAMQLTVTLLAVPLQALGQEDFQRPQALANNTGGGFQAEGTAAKGTCVIEAGGLTLESDASTAFSILENENGKTVAIRSGRMAFALNKHASNAEFTTPFGAVRVSLTGQSPDETAGGEMSVSEKSAVCIVTNGTLLLDSERGPQVLPAGRVLVLTDAGDNETPPVVSAQRPGSPKPGTALAFGAVSAVVAGAFIIAEGMDEDSGGREVSPH
jgi:hypothetical protein